jgi:hypothetical protein
MPLGDKTGYLNPDSKRAVAPKTQLDSTDHNYTYSKLFLFIRLLISSSRLIYEIYVNTQSLLLYCNAYLLLALHKLLTISELMLFFNDFDLLFVYDSVSLQSIS